MHADEINPAPKKPPQIRVNTEYSRRFFRRLIPVTVLILVLAIPTFIQFTRAMDAQTFSSAAIALLVAWTAVVLGGATWVGRLELEYRCPQCHAHLPGSVQIQSDDQPTFFLCPACNIKWVTAVGDEATERA